LSARITRRRYFTRTTTVIVHTTRETAPTTLPGSAASRFRPKKTSFRE
jgi:hypothetical protein